MRLEIILLGVIQGLTEWLPISSTGHLRLAEIILGLRLPMLFDIILHVGTLAVTVLFFRDDIKKILRALARLNTSEPEGGILLQRIIVGTAFTAITGFVMAPLESLFHETKILGLSFLLSGAILYLSKMGIARRGFIDFKRAAAIGAMQGFSILPGLSRSGLTMSTALILGVDCEEAFKFSFLLSIPTIFGGLIATSMIQYSALQEARLEFGEILLGTLVSVILGYLSLKILRRTLKHLHKYALYPLLFGSLLILFDGF
ncbi:MAG: undecaprenyl-diphosphate phosphatase [Candidatus Bathyarchaeia archaeon]